MTQISTGNTSDHLQSLPLDVVGLRKTYPDKALSLWHDHPRHQLIYAISGLMMAETEGTRWSIPAGYGLIMPATTSHQIRMVGQVDLQTLYLRPQAAPTLSSCRVISISPLLTALIASFTKLDNPLPETPRSHHLGALILLELSAAPDSPLALPFPNHPALRRVCETLQQQPGLAHGLDHWADTAGLSRRSFTRVFQNETGLSFGKWTQRLRCQLALERMATGRPLARIAHDLGYASPYALRAMMDRLV